MEIQKIQFGVLSKEDIENMSVCEITRTDLCNPTVGNEDNCRGTVYDRAMGFSKNLPGTCITCNQPYKYCPGHMGHINFSEPIFNPMFFDEIVKYLKCFCHSCGKPLVRIEPLVNNNFSLKNDNDFKYFLNLCKSTKKCFYCNHAKFDISYDAINYEVTLKSIDDSEPKILTPKEAFDNIFSNIDDKILNNLGLDTKMVHPKNFIMHNFPIMPPCARPCVNEIGNSTCDDDLTGRIIDIVKVNNQIKDIKEKKPLDFHNTAEFRTYYSKLKTYVNTFYNNSSGKAQRPTTGRPIKAISERLKGKDGRMRKNIMGKRVDYSARTVITPDPNLPFGTLGIPRKIAKILTFPETVTYFNKEYLTTLVNKNYASFIDRKGSHIYVKEKSKLVDLKEGDILYKNIFLIKQDTPSSVFKFDAKTDSLYTKRVKVTQKIIDKNRHKKLSSKYYSRIIRNDNTTYISKNTDVSLSVGDILIRKNYVRVSTNTNGIPDTYQKDDIIVYNTNKPITINKQNIKTFSLSANDFIKRVDKNRNKDIFLKCKNHIELELGDIVHRFLIDGDVVLLNRQPTLHKGSMLAKTIRIFDRKTFSMNLATTKTFNADFDGDEMNIHVPQSYEARTELLLLAASKQNIVSEQGSSPNIAIVQDSLLGARNMTLHNKPLTKQDFMDIVSTIQINDKKVSFAYIKQKIKIYKKVFDTFKKSYDHTNIYTPKLLISLLLPNDFIYSKSTHANKKLKVKIHNGILYEGVLDKSSLGSSHNSIIQKLNTYYNEHIAAEFVSNIQFVTNKWLMNGNNFSIGIDDCMVQNQNTLVAIKKINESCSAYAKALSDNFSKNQDHQEIKVMAALNKQRDKSILVVKDDMRSNNRLRQAVDAGSKGDTFNITQTIAALGQQNLKKGRVPKMLRGRRTLPHYPMKESDMNTTQLFESRGFIRHSLTHGLSPQEFFFYSMSGREGICDTAMGTSISGYIQRKLVKLMEDCQVHYDGTVRNSNGSIVQFSYGDNNISCNKLTYAKVPVLDHNNNYISKIPFSRSKEYELDASKKVVVYKEKKHFLNIPDIARMVNMEYEIEKNNASEKNMYKELLTFLSKHKIIKDSNDNLNLDQMKIKILDIGTLNLSNRNLSSLPSTLSLLENVTSMDLSHNALSHIPNELHMMHELKTLNISHNQFTSFPSIILQFKNLQQLNCSDNNFDMKTDTHITSYFNMFSTMDYDTKLVLSSQLEQDFETYVSQKLHFIQWLNDNKNEKNVIINFDESDSSSSSIIDINMKTIHLISSLSLTNIQNFSTKYFDLIVKFMPNITILKLNHLGMTQFPMSILSLSKLKYIDVSHNNMVKIDFNTDLKHIDHVKYLNVSHNQLKTTPSNLSVFQYLHTFDISHNQLTRFDMFQYFTNDSKDTWKSYKKNVNDQREKIKKQLTDIEIKMNTIKLQYSDETIPKLSQDELERYEANIKKLNKSLLDLNKKTHATLSVLKINSNQITKMPLDIKYLSSLKELHFENNQMEAVPFHFKLKLENLRYVSEHEYEEKPKDKL